MVPLADAHRSGAATWPAGYKQVYANDLAIADALIAVSASANRSKSDQSPDEWMPTNTTSHCRYATAWVDVKYRWSLTVTNAERSALERAIVAC